MTLPSSGNISLTMIQDEFLAPRGTNLRAFYRGGSYVPNTPQNAAVPTSGAISIKNFYGAARTQPLSASAPAAHGSVFSPEPAPSFRTVSAGTTVTATGGTGNYSYGWTYLSGSSMNFNNGGSPAGRQPSWDASVPKNDQLAASWRCTVSDGVSIFQFDIPVSLEYFTDL